MTEEELARLHPDIFAKWYDYGYSAGYRAKERHLAQNGQTTQRHLYTCQAAEKCQYAIKLESKLKGERNTIEQLKVLYRKALKDNQKARKRVKLYIPSKDNQQIVKDVHFCVYCGEKATTADHLIPKSRGGHDGYSNLAPSYYACNQEKGNMTYDEYITWRTFHKPI